MLRAMLLTGVLGLAFSQAQAQNIHLATVPERDEVQLTIYNSEDLTLVRERRRISFKPGPNPLQFSWANTLIDPTSVELRFASHPEQLLLLDTTFPHDRPQSLVWNVQSDGSVQASVEISYFTSGITWDADYRVIAAADASVGAITGFVRVLNRSGEDYENARVRLVVGTINLVEKIAELARLPVNRLSELSRDDFRVMRQTVARSLMAAEVAPAAEPKAITTDALSDYFIYTIEGTETVPNGWARRLRSFAADAVPLQVEYRYRPREYGEQLVQVFRMHNVREGGLGETPLPDGTVRVFRDNGHDGLALLARIPIRYVSIGDHLELPLGPDPKVVLQQRTLRAWRDNIWLRLAGIEAYRQVDGPGVDVNLRGSVAGWDQHHLVIERIGNHHDRPVRVELRRAFPGDVRLRTAEAARLHDAQTVVFEIGLEPGQRLDLPYQVTERMGRNARQQRLELETENPDGHSP